MDNELLIIVLSSTVLATVITCFFNYLVNNKNHISDNIVGERKIWREAMRSISKELNDAMDVDAVRIVIAKIKVNINAFGYRNTDNYMQDGHIWKVIKKFENEEKLDNNLLIKYKNVLTNMISALLKYDWERSKGEIRGNLQIKGIILTNIICTVVGVVSSNLSLNYMDEKNSLVSDMQPLVFMMIAVGCFTAGVYSLICIVDRYIVEEIKTGAIGIKLAGSLVGTIIVFWAIIDNVLGREAVLEIIGQQYTVAVNFQTASLFISGLLTLEYVWNIYYNQWVYFKTVFEMEKILNIDN